MGAQDVMNVFRRITTSVADIGKSVTNAVQNLQTTVTRLSNEQVDPVQDIESLRPSRSTPLPSPRYSLRDVLWSRSSSCESVQILIDSDQCAESREPIPDTDTSARLSREEFWKNALRSLRISKERSSIFRT